MTKAATVCEKGSVIINFKLSKRKYYLLLGKRKYARLLKKIVELV
jgi:hypothetical protein